MVAASLIPTQRRVCNGRFPRMLQFNSLVNENDYSAPYVVCDSRIKIVITYVCVQELISKLENVNRNIRFVLNT